MSQSLEQGKRKLTAKDAITAGALGAVCIAIRFVFMLVGGVSPYVWFATHLIDVVISSNISSSATRPPKETVIS